MLSMNVSVQQIIPAWEIFHSVTNIGTIKNHAHYEFMVQVLEDMLKIIGTNEYHPAMGLIDIIGNLIEDYELEDVSLPQPTGLQALNFLMAQHNLMPKHLLELGNESVVSDILSGKVELDIEQIRALAKRFNVTPATFI